MSVKKSDRNRTTAELKKIYCNVTTGDVMVYLGNYRLVLSLSNKTV